MASPSSPLLEYYCIQDRVLPISAGLTGVWRRETFFKYTVLLECRLPQILAQALPPEDFAA
jgi:hypothetical protein